MQHNGPSPAVRRLLDSFSPRLAVEEARTPPALWYIDPEFFAWECYRLLCTWQPAARLSCLEKPGTYVAGRWLNLPYVVVRDEKGTLRALANVCRHHAAEVAVGTGCAAELVCPYHGWSYHLHGGLKRAPGLGRTAGFRVEEHALPPLHVECWGPWAWIHGGTPEGSLREALQPLYLRLAGMEFESLTHVARREYELACNWKVFVDNYLDGGYHVASVHAGLAGGLDLSQYRSEMHERFSIQSCPAAAEHTPSGVEFAERLEGTACYAWIYPNFMINRYGPMMDTNWVVPLSVNRTRVVFDYFFEASHAADAAFVERSLAASHVVQVEDTAVCESVQRGLASGCYQQGPYAAAEAPMFAFHRLLWAELSGQSGV
jgi:choline monooxygenase